MIVAVIGLGTMGAPMAKNLLAKGFEVVVHNRTRSREAPLIERGAKPAASPGEAATFADAVLLCVSDTPDVEAVLLQPNRGVLSSMKRGGLVIDCSSIAPDATRRFAQACAERGVGYVDAPVSGGSEGAEKATLAIMCGGTKNDVARARPILEAIGRTITHVGGVGAGQIAKAVNQVVIAGTYQALAEGLILAKKAGADPEKVLAAISGGAAKSWVLENRAPNMLRDQYPLGFRVALHRKDLGIALRAAAESGADLPLTQLVAKAEDQLIANGYGDEDTSALAREVRRKSSLAPGPL